MIAVSKHKAVGRVETMDAAKTAKAEKVFRSNLDNQFEKVEEQARRLALIKQELETLEAPTRRDVAEVRARIDETDRKFTKVRFLCSQCTHNWRPECVCPASSNAVIRYPKTTL